jgi:hypothetical protein
MTRSADQVTSGGAASDQQRHDTTEFTIDRQIEVNETIGSGCPLSAATAHHPEACLIVEAFLSEIIGFPVKERCHHGDAPRCRFDIS